jgi:phosphoribosyl-ATP pyrophosphohydrolase
MSDNLNISLYHLLVLLAARGLPLADVEAELARRRR